MASIAISSQRRMRRLCQFLRVRSNARSRISSPSARSSPSNDNASEDRADVGRLIAVDVIHDEFLAAVDAEDAGEFDDQSRFFPRLADRAVGGVSHGSINPPGKTQILRSE